MKKLLEGDRIILTSIREEDTSIIEKWYNDMDFLRNFEKPGVPPMAKIQILKMLKEIQEASDEYLFGIRDKEKNSLIGIIGFEKINWVNGVAQIYIGIGENDFKGIGYGFEAMSLGLDYAFYELSLHRVQLNVFSYNQNAIGLYEKIGFKREGILREYINRDGKRFDIYVYGILKYEWDKTSLYNLT